MDYKKKLYDEDLIGLMSLINVEFSARAAEMTDAEKASYDRVTNLLNDLDNKTALNLEEAINAYADDSETAGFREGFRFALRMIFSGLNYEQKKA